MGQRANLIVTEKGQSEVYYTHWRANTLPRDLFWGPAFATLFARSQRREEARNLLDDVWAEGGAVIDHDRREFILFGGDDLRYDLRQRRIYLRLLATAWEGWQVRWAFEGVCEMADHLAVPRDWVLARRNPPQQISLDPPEQPSWADNVLSIRRARGAVLLFPLSASGWHYPLAGPMLLETIRDEGVPTVIQEPDQTFEIGIHIDETRNTVEFWTGRDAAGLLQRVAEAWKGWDVTWHRDRFEFQVERTDGRFHLGTSTQGCLVSALRGMLLHEEQQSAVDMFLEMTKKPHESQCDVTGVNPLASRDARLTLPAAVREEMVNRAIAAL